MYIHTKRFLSTWQIEILLACLGKMPLEDHGIKTDAPGFPDAINDLINMGLITRDNESLSGYSQTSKGAAHMESLCALPLPKETGPAWIHPITHEVIAVGHI